MRTVLFLSVVPLKMFSNDKRENVCYSIYLWYIDCSRIFWCWILYNQKIYKRVMLSKNILHENDVVEMLCLPIIMFCQPSVPSGLTINYLIYIFCWAVAVSDLFPVPDCLPPWGSQPPLFVPRHLRPPWRLRAAEDGLGGVRVPLRPVLQWRRPGEVRTGAQVRGGPEAGRSSHPPARRLQWTELRQQGRSAVLCL